MRKNILITGTPRSGKSTLLRKLICHIPNAVGLVTNEILDGDGRIGFEMETHAQDKAILAHKDFGTPYKVSKYSVDVRNLDSLLPQVSGFSEDSLLYLDEIGQMQLFSEEFRRVALIYLDAPNTCIITISYIYEDTFTKEIKERNDVILVEISAETRKEKEEFISQLIKKIEKAKKYIAEPERFTIKGPIVQLKSEHASRNLLFKDSRWTCSCDFFNQYEICSHTIATEEIMKR